MIYYAGIGSRKTPDDILAIMYKLAQMFARRGFTLRSGGADGADSAFELGCEVRTGAMEIFLPWKAFNNNPSYRHVIPDEAYTIAAQYHPAWDTLQPSVRNLMARNTQQILGENLDSPSSFVVCWTPDGCNSHETRTYKTGGTGQAISIASDHGIPVFNLQQPTAFEDLRTLVEKLEKQ